ncbi:hypothetical protein GCM10009608_48420 [Pseudonocardia alaniniphila]
MNERSFPSVAVTTVTVVSAGVLIGLGVWMWGWPASFSAYVNFPIHVHFLHDMGVFHIGLATGMLVALFRRDAIYAVLLGFTVICVLHAINHVIDLDIGGNPSDPYLIAGQAVISGVGVWLRGRQLAGQPQRADTADRSTSSS